MTTFTSPSKKVTILTHQKERAADGATVGAEYQSPEREAAEATEK